MKILHYSLGFPPYRTGGLTKYSYDLMKEQILKGDYIYALFPGRISFKSVITKVKYYKNKGGIKTFEIINPLPVPLLNGISNYSEFMKPVNVDIFKNFLESIDVDIVHIHTFMGLHKEFLIACRELDIKVCYTTHDYFGICTKVNFIDYNGKLCHKRNIEKCIICNKHAYKMRTIKILQSPIYRTLKNIGVTPKIKLIMKKLKKSKQHNVKDDNNFNENKVVTSKEKNNYSMLLNYYNEMFKYIDKFFFNSSVSKEVYNKYISVKGDIISITHGDVKDNRQIKCYKEERLKLTYLGADKAYKGFNLIYGVVSEINREYPEKIELNIYGNIEDAIGSSGINIHGRYGYSDLELIFRNTDILVVPSICNETFGFITLEAISYGVSVLVSDTVGSKDLIGTMNPKGIITRADNQELKDSILDLVNNRDKLVRLNKNIVEGSFDYLIGNHYEDVRKAYMTL